MKMKREYLSDEELLDYVRWSKQHIHQTAADKAEQGNHPDTNDVSLWLFHLWFWHDIPVYTGRGRGSEKTWHTWEGDNLGYMTSDQIQKKHDAVFGPHEHKQQMLLLDTTEVDR